MPYRASLYPHFLCFQVLFRPNLEVTLLMLEAELKTPTLDWTAAAGKHK
jgi:hypothetical protein